LNAIAGFADASLGSSVAQASGRQHGIGGLIYPMRILGAGTCALITGVYLAHLETVRLYYPILLGLALLYPHMSRAFASRRSSRRTVENVSVLVDGFVLGSTVFVTGFSLLPSLILLTTMTANALGINGPRLLGWTLLSAGVGMGLPLLLYGGGALPPALPQVDFICGAYLVLHFNVFAYTAYTRSRLLRSSREELKQQQLTTEIEKKRSDALLLAILPAAVAGELAAHKEVAPRLIESATVLLVDFDGFDALLDEHGPAATIGELNQCFKAFDAIVTRHGLEAIKTVGDDYLAVGGVLAADQRHAEAGLRAAGEILEYVGQRAQADRLPGTPRLQARVAVHSGPLVAGIVETRKFCYEVWGETLDLTRELQRQAAAGEATISETALALVGQVPEEAPTGSVKGRNGEDVAFYSLKGALPG
jgi:class 3 adenylate cyclase